MGVLDDYLAQQSAASSSVGLRAPPQSNGQPSVSPGKPVQQNGEPIPPAKNTGSLAPEGTSTPDNPEGNIKGTLGKVLDVLNPFSKNRDNQAAYMRNKVNPALGAAVLRAPGQLVGGAIDTANDVGKFIGDNMEAGLARVPVVGAAVATFDQKNQAAAAAWQQRVMGTSSMADVLSMRSSLGQVGSPGINQFATEGLASAAPVAAVGKVGLAARAVAAAAGYAVAGDPNAPNGRLGNAAVAGGMEVGGEAFVASLKLAGKFIAKQGVKWTTAKPAEALADALDRDHTTNRTEAARDAAAETVTNPQQSSVPPVQDAPQEVTNASRHSDAPPAPAAEGGPVDHPNTPLANDANAALDKAGAAERVDPETMHITSDGKVLVAPATKDALDNAHMGRAFAATDSSPDTVIWKEKDAQGGQRIVGSMDKYDLQEFKNNAEAYSAEAAKGSPLDTQPDSHVGQWKLGNLGASYDVGGRLRAMSDTLEGSARPKSDAELYAQAEAIAAQFGGTPEERALQAQALAGRAVPLDADMLAHRMLLAKTAADLEPHLGQDYASLDPAHPSIQSAADAIHNLLTLTTAGEEAKTGVARALRAGGLPDDIAKLPDHQSYKNAFGKAPPGGLAPKNPQLGPGLPRTPQELQQWLDLYGVAKGTEDPQVLSDFLKGQTWTPNKWNYLRNSFPNFFTAAIVSAPRTIVRDLWGPAIVSGLNTIGRITAGGAGAVNPFASASERALAWSTSTGAAHAYTQTFGDFLDGLRFIASGGKAGDTQGVVKAAGATIKKGFDKGAPAADAFSDPFGSNLGSSSGVLGGHNPVEFNTQGVPRAMMDAALQDQGHGVTGAVPFYLGNLINKLPQAVHALHGGVNELAQRLAYLGEVRASAYNEFTQQNLKRASLGMQPLDDLKGYLHDRLTSSVDVAGKALDSDNLAAAERTTFTKRPDPNDNVWLQKSIGMRNSLVKAIPEMRYILPIFTVPANAMGETIRRIPGAGLLFKQSRDELLGHAGVPAQVDAYGRMLTGGAALGAGWMMAKAGNLTGSGPLDPHDKAAWLATHQPYSIRVGDKWYSYAKSDIVGPMLGIMAGSYDASVFDSEDKPHGAFAAAAGLAEYFKDQAGLQTLSHVLNLGASPGASDSEITRLLGGTAGGFVPGFVEQLREQVDPVQRTKRTIWDYVQDRIPGYSQQLDPTRNYLGEVVDKPQSPLGNTFPVNIARANTFDKDPVMDVVAKLYQDSGYAPGALSPSGGPQAKFDMRDVKLEDGHSLYDALMRGRNNVQIDGQTLRQALTELIQSPDFAEAPPGKGKFGDPGEDRDNTRGGLMASVFAKYNVAIKQQVAKDSPEATKWMNIAEAKAGNSVKLHSVSAQQLHDDPGGKLAKSLGIDLSDYTDKSQGN